MTHISDARIEAAAQKADDAFWKVIAQELPEITRGDIDPGTKAMRDDQNAAIVRLWVDENQMTEDEVLDEMINIVAGHLRHEPCQYTERAAPNEIAEHLVVVEQAHRRTGLAWVPQCGPVEDRNLGFMTREEAQATFTEEPFQDLTL